MELRVLNYFLAIAREENFTRAAQQLHVTQPTFSRQIADLDWTNKRSRSSLEMNNPACRPEIAAQCPNMAQYDTVFIGFPIWWYVAPSIINTFVERYDFSGKTLVLFATSGGSGLGRTVAGLKKLCPAANWNEGKLVNGMSEQALRSWATAGCSPS